MTGLPVQNTAAMPLQEQEKGKDPLRFLLHALNQPLTGLQCIMELSVSCEGLVQWRDTAREALELTAQMRGLVGALREVVDFMQSRPGTLRTSFSIGALVRDCLAELLPVAESKRIRFNILGDIESFVHADRGLCYGALFRLLESALAAMHRGDRLELVSLTDADAICLSVSWKGSPHSQSASISNGQLGIVIAHSAFEAAGAIYTQRQQEEICTCTVRLPLAGCVTGQGPEVQK